MKKIIIILLALIPLTFTYCSVILPRQQKQELAKAATQAAQEQEAENTLNKAKIEADNRAATIKEHNELVRRINDCNHTNQGSAWMLVARFRGVWATTQQDHWRSGDQAAAYAIINKICISNEGSYSVFDYPYPFLCDFSFYAKKSFSQGWNASGLDVARHMPVTESNGCYEPIR
jgi:hypothetical protein